MRARIGGSRGRLQRRRASRGAAGCGVLFGFRPYWEGGRSIQDRPPDADRLLVSWYAGAPARARGREAGPQEKHRGWFRHSPVTRHAGARVGRLRQGRTVLEHDGGSQLIEREAKPLRCAASASLLPPGQAIPRREAEGWRVQEPSEHRLSPRSRSCIPCSPST